MIKIFKYSLLIISCCCGCLTWYAAEVAPAELKAVTLRYRGESVTGSFIT